MRRNGLPWTHNTVRLPGVGGPNVVPLYEGCTVRRLLPRSAGQ